MKPFVRQGMIDMNVGLIVLIVLLGSIYTVLAKLTYEQDDD